VAKTISRTDDLDPKKLADETIKFSFDGNRYEIDLTSENASGFRKHLEPWVQKATKLGAAGATAGLDLAAVRAWCAANKIEVGAKGRLPRELIERYKTETGMTVEKKADAKPSNGKEKAAKKAA
jgi:hypothetical protein